MATKKKEDEQGKTKKVPRPEVEYIDDLCVCGLPAGHHGGCQKKSLRTIVKKSMAEKIAEREKTNPA